MLVVHLANMPNNRTSCSITDAKHIIFWLRTLRREEQTDSHRRKLQQTITQLSRGIFTFIHIARLDDHLQFMCVLHGSCCKVQRRNRLVSFQLAVEIEHAFWALWN